MAFEELIGLGSGVPDYHNPCHQQQYDTQAIREPENFIQLLAETLDDRFLYPEHNVGAVRISYERVPQEYDLVSFKQHYKVYPKDGITYVPDTVSLSINHLQHLGKGAIKQTYSLLVERQVANTGSITRANQIVTKYNIQQTSDAQYPYEAQILRPDILTVGNLDAEPMTEYDCIQLIELLGKLARVDQKNNH